LEHYLALADAFYQVAQIDKAVEKYHEALRLASRASQEKKWRVILLRKMGDIHVRRGRWQEAVQAYNELVALVPEDERARLQLIDLYYKLNREGLADREVVKLIEYFRSMDEPDRALALLEEAVRLQPHQMALRARLARVYIDAGQKEDAIRELDTLGELQLDAGLREQATATVRFIISLRPDNSQAYRELLEQL
jgi:tetratricopeptide (TPR) repeat protein